MKNIIDNLEEHAIKTINKSLLEEIIRIYESDYKSYEDYRAEIEAINKFIRKENIQFLNETGGYVFKAVKPVIPKDFFEYIKEIKNNK